MTDLWDDRQSIESFTNNGVDWRLPENRVESFTRVFNTRMLEGELDHHLAGRVIADWMALDNERKAWYALLFGFSYRNHWAMIVLQLYPNIWGTPVEEIRQWYNDSEGKEDGAWRRVKFAKDTKWNVRKFPDFIASVQEWLGGESLYAKLMRLSSVGTTAENFDSLNRALIDNLHGIGRMTSWLAIQTIYEFFDWDIDKWDLQLKDEGCWSQYDAMCYLYDKMDWQGEKRTPERLAFMDAKTQELMEYISERVDYHVDIYNVESCLCEYRKTSRTDRKAKEFTFWAANELVEQFPELYGAWETHEPKINWDGYVVATMCKGKNVTNFGYDKIYFRVLTETGLNLNTHFHYPDEPDAFEILQIPRPEDCPRPELFFNMYDAVVATKDAMVQDSLERFTPELHLRWNS